jgi:hypothetical protein
MTKAETASSAMAAMVDELGSLEEELAPHKSKLARVEVLRKALRAPYLDADPNTTFLADGERFRALIGAAGNQSYVDGLLLLKLVGAQKFAAAATVSVSALQANFTADIAGAVTRTAQTGVRRLELIELSSIKRRAS